MAIPDLSLSARRIAPSTIAPDGARATAPNREWLIPSETWKSEVAVGHNPTLVARVLAERGMLKRANDGFQCVERIEGIPQRVYVVTASILSEPGHE